MISGADCWCSDFAPGRTASISACDKDCNGFPSEKCGGDGFFAYIALEKQPSGTVGAPAPPSPSPKNEPDSEPDDEPVRDFSPALVALHLLDIIAYKILVSIVILMMARNPTTKLQSSLTTKIIRMILNLWPPV